MRSHVSDNWFYADDDGLGPVTLRELKETLATFSNPEEVFVWCERFQDWVASAARGPDP
jgi:hypothetical protein